MAERTYATGDAEVAKLWSKRLAIEAMKQTQIAQYCADDDKALGMIVTDAQKSAGDNVTVTLRMQGTGDGVTENTPQEGNEEEFVTKTDTLIINELSHAFRSRRGGVVQQRVPWAIGEQLNNSLVDWWATRMDVIAFNHLCGYTPANTQAASGQYNGFNTINAPSSGRKLYTEAGDTVDTDLDSTGDEFTLAMVDKCVELAQTGGSTGLPVIRPIKNKGLNSAGADFIMFLHPTQVTQLRTTSGSTWQAVQQAVLSGGDIKNNPIMTGAVGVYNKTLLVPSAHCTYGVDGSGAAVTTVRRAVFCGAQALSLGFGKGFGPDQWQVEEELFDYKRRVGYSGLNVFGIKAARYNSSDFAKIVVSSYAADAA